jgi:hypothetical protein
VRHENILGVIGDTPLVGVHALSPNPDVKIFAKLEGQNPGGSSKDRIALKMIELAEAAGELHRGDTILEPSSGNTGIGLALVAKLRGYKLRVVMPENVSIERRQLLEIFGAEIVLSPAEQGSNGAIALSEKLGADDPSLVRLFQFQLSETAEQEADYGKWAQTWGTLDPSGLSVGLWIQAKSPIEAFTRWSPSIRRAISWDVWGTGISTLRCTTNSIATRRPRWANHRVRRWRSR